MEFGLLAIFILFTVALFEEHKNDKWFFFLVTGIGGFYGLMQYVLPMFIPVGYLSAIKHGVELALMASGTYGVFKKKLQMNQENK